MICGLFMMACGEAPPVDPGADAGGHTAPSADTIRVNAALLEQLPFEDRQDFLDANRGLVARHPRLIIRGEGDEPVWDQPSYGFIEGDAPGSVNPSLWRQASLNNIHGLFQVADGIYQLRGFDLSNMTIIEGRSGWIVVDPLTARETAEQAIAFARDHLDARPIVAVVFTHSHVDHFGGILGLLTEQEIQSGKIRIIAPEGFMREATSENLIAGNAMSRRAMLMYGKQLARSERGHVGSGLGKGTAFGQFGILAPTETVNRTPQTLEIDGIEFRFQYAPESEAPAEMTFYLPHWKAFCGAEVTSRNMHNIYTLRGARVRDALRWSGYIDEALELFGDAEIFFASHHWPMWGTGRIRVFLEQQRDTYKYIHDQTVRLFNEGLTPGEIAEALELPESLRKAFSSRGYYGTTRHNARAVYQAYLGWYDGNPANLDPLPPAQAGKRYVGLMGGSSAVLDKARIAFEDAEYRWVAELLNHLVFAEPDNAAARDLLARTYDQLGYRSESGPWRDSYLSAAWELRHGPPEEGIEITTMEDVLTATPVERFFDTLAVRLNGPDAEGKTLAVQINFSDLDKQFLLDISNAVLHHRPALPGAEPDATLTLTHGMFIRMLTGQAGAGEILLSDEVDIEGSVLDLVNFFSLFDKPNPVFNIVTP
jgi:alkyl sulfatase BDS1-like metallo-beta-lactamase superfamily hydrolase